jgi:hypothetical protein
MLLVAVAASMAASVEAAQGRPGPGVAGIVRSSVRRAMRRMVVTVRGRVLMLVLLLLLLLVPANQVGSNGTTDRTETSMPNLVAKQASACCSQNRFAKPSFSLWAIRAGQSWATGGSCISWVAVAVLSRRRTIGSLLWWVRGVATIVIVAAMGRGLALLMSLTVWTLLLVVVVGRRCAIARLAGGRVGTVALGRIG